MPIEAKSAGAGSVLVTGGAGFIGSSFVEQLVKLGQRVVVLDALTYAGHPANLRQLEGRFEFVRGDIRDRALVRTLFERHRFSKVFNFAAESHVDRSIESAQEFVETNIMGVFSLLDASLRHFETLKGSERESFRYIQISTDEVFGSLGDTGFFTETTPYAPNSPYSASKAAGDHLVRAWFHTYKLPTITTNCSNNYGPRQFPEKLIPRMIQCAISGEGLPVYGQGLNVRDWIHVADHAQGVWLAGTKGQPGETYCFGGRSERKNIDVVHAICDLLDRQKPRGDKLSYRSQIRFVEDRKGHDWRYAIDDAKSERELGFKRAFPRFEQGLEQTIDWYLANSDWVKEVTSPRS